MLNYLFNKPLFKYLAVLLLGLSLGWLLGTRQHSDSDPSSLPRISDGLPKTHYTCPMHPQISAAEAGSCPICGMNLVEKYAEHHAEKSTFSGIKITPDVSHNLGVRTVTVKRANLPHSIETLGKITRVDPMARRTLTPPIPGILTYLAPLNQGDFVEPGELLFSVSSEALFQTERAYQQAVNNHDRGKANDLVVKLRDMGLSPKQLEQLQSSQEPNLPIEVVATEKAIVYTSRGTLDEPVHTGFTVFNLGGNYQVIEVTAEVFERQWQWLEQGQKALMTVRGLPGQQFVGKVVRVEPPVGYTTRSLEVALKFKTDNTQLSQSMFAHVSIQGQPRNNVLAVPMDALIRTATSNRVIVVDGDDYQPTEVSIGDQSDGLVEITGGLEEGQEIVSSGQFLIDSESSIQAELQRMHLPAKPGAAPSAP